MKTKNVMDGLVILFKYYGDAYAGYNLGADHDILYVFPPENPVSEEDRAKLYDLGWFQLNCKEKEYNLEETWAANL